ncbi:MAG: LacI family DNA-binding transcriptional regulator [Paenibacillus macerans]|uniref:LacI family DNA-binding transcriptional regulator n=1 Tax=Paenibacillus macerans TaxID=44252 RepID=A0A090ZVL4_PAEMA|nr:LacI family DNA-binding transcriptional regulator [Paenibacillus macerans]KFN08151.1 periplasmic binding s and sugar binding domain of LacI family protein [Paenibacillus macerans]MBS5914004.1 LacI family DNA-binding transcriptional regulator [Paenibacillus macerans]MCY7557583.1 LacI family DNA-binding transcriptional regulator [Paenibacillus macerans]MDU7474748.1 LacI family DNA-binding transcriptional regulator [Paenibacillus macerans]MEC0137510.1 LacI family DNA-binding transcriptional re
MSSIKDVANLAGVAVGTVSRVINNSGAVKPATRRKVEAAIQELNYIPNEIARNFKMRKSKMVALLLPSIWHPFFSELAYYIEDELDREGYKLMLCNSGGKPEKELYYLDMLQQNKVAGIVGITYNDIENDVSKDIPIVSIDRHFNKKITCVTSDNFEGGCLALKELVKAGVRKPAFLGSVTSVFSETMNRREGFVHEAKTMGVDYVVYEKPDPVVDDDAYFEQFLDEFRDVDGIFAITDMFAAKYIERAGRRGIRVPEDVKVIGYDGIQDHPYFHPILSTIRQPVEEMARTAIRLLFKRIEGETLDREVYRLPVIFRQGETT